MVATILGRIASSFGSLKSLSWIITTFPLAASVTQPLSGHLSDVFGRRNAWILCNILLLAGTLCCGLSHRLWLFLLGRVLQGIGGGCISAITAHIESDLVTTADRALVEGLGNIVYGVVVALAGFYGGSVTTAIGWRWTFFLQAPGMAIMLVAAFFLIENYATPGNDSKHGSPWTRIDYLGSFLLLTTVLFFQLGLTVGSTSGWSSPLVITSLVVSGLSCIAFVLWELNGVPIRPVIPLRALADRTITSSLLSSLFGMGSYQVILFYIPTYLEQSGDSLGTSGLHFIPLAVALGISSFACGAIVTKTRRYYLLNVVCQSLSITAVALLCALHSYGANYVPYILLALLGAGSGGTAVTLLMGLLNTTDNTNQATIQAAAWSIRSAGSTVFLTIASAIFQHRLYASLRAVPNLLSEHSELIHNITTSFVDVTTLDNRLSSITQKEIRSVYLIAARAPFYLSLGGMTLAGVFSLLMRSKRIGIPAQPAGHVEATDDKDRV